MGLRCFDLLVSMSIGPVCMRHLLRESLHFLVKKPTIGNKCKANLQFYIYFFKEIILHKVSIIVRIKGQ